jgi:hypothetical protein
MKSYLFIDESGDPFFFGNRNKLLFGTEGFQPFLIIGLIQAEDRKLLRSAVVSFIQNIKADNLYNTIPSVNHQKGWYVHARSDHPEIRAKFFEMLRGLEGFKAHIVIAKKNLNIFNRKHNNNPTEFYFDVLHHLLKEVFIDHSLNYQLYLSHRGNNSIHRFEEAVKKALASEIKIKYNLEIVPSREMPELSIIDYLMWAVQRNLLKGESRFFDALKCKYGNIINLYEEE